MAVGFFKSRTPKRIFWKSRCVLRSLSVAPLANNSASELVKFGSAGFAASMTASKVKEILQPIALNSVQRNRSEHFRCFFDMGKIRGTLYIGATFPYTVPLPNIFVTHLFSSQTLKRKDFQEIIRLTWAQECCLLCQYKSSAQRSPGKID